MESSNISSHIRFRAKYFADGTGDGWIGYFAGASCMCGREDKDAFG